MNSLRFIERCFAAAALAESLLDQAESLRRSQSPS